VRVRFAFEGAETEVAVSDPSLAPSVAMLFPDSRIEERAESVSDGRIEVVAGQASDSPRESGEGHTPMVMRVTSGPDGYAFFSREGCSTFDSVPDLLSAVEFAVVSDLLAQDDDSTHLHAAGAVTMNGAVLVSGSSGAGKSSLALAWSLAGRPLLGDDVVRLDENGLLGPFPKLLKVDPDLVTHHGLALDATPAWEPGCDEAWFDPVSAGGWASAGCRAALVARIEYRAGDAVHVREEEPGVGLRLLLDAVQMTGLPREQSMDRIIALLEGARVFDVRFGSAREAAHVLTEMVGESGAPRTPSGGIEP